ncbi:2OG-Fe(II) oxygenase [Mycolicibacterium sp.]|uniref:2OG-Fe(II) oxygenase n=1 Tax=Mycolicibacterium sp. TaxID=2320850 RepID=UPI00355D8118
MARNLLNVEKLKRNAPDLRRKFQTAEPFSHLVLDDFLRLAPSSADVFPDSSWPSWNEVDDGYIRNKRFCFDIDRIPEPFTTFIRELNEPPFLRVLEEITGIDKLLPDPYLFGGGLHLSGPGGILTPHTDFHYHRALNLYRRINIIVYLNEDWSLDDGGCLSFYDQSGEAVQTVVPEWGTAVVFRTDDQSVHGYTVPIAEGRWRRSVALFYYTAAPTSDFSGDETTYYREHGQHTGVARKARQVVFTGLMGVSRNISILAHIVNPNLGIPAVKAYFAYLRKTRRERAESLGDGDAC